MGDSTEVQMYHAALNTLVENHREEIERLKSAYMLRIDADRDHIHHLNVRAGRSDSLVLKLLKLVEKLLLASSEEGEDEIEF